MSTVQIKDGFEGGSDNQLKVNPDGSINTNPSGGGSTQDVFAGAFNPPFLTDAMQATYPTSIQEVYEFFQGGLSGILLMTLTVNYTDSSKTVISDVVRT